MKVMKYTINDVAKLAKVSKSTVSRAFTSIDLVSEKTYKKVMDAAKELDYKPNPIARALNISTTNTITIVIPNIESIIMTSIIRGCMHYLAKQDYSLVVLDSSENYTDEINYADLLSSRLTDGVIFCYGSAKQTMSNIKSRLPVLFVEMKSEDEDIDCVLIDFKSGFKKLVMHLMELKHKDIGIVLGKKDEFSQSRLRIILNVANELGIKIKNENICFNNWTIMDGYQSMIELLHQKQSPTAVIYLSDFMAMGGIRAANEMGLKVPRDITIVGCDDSLTSAFTVPALTTLLYSPYSLGMKAAEIMLKRIKQPDGKKVIETIQADIKIRSSSDIVRINK